MDLDARPYRSFVAIAEKGSFSAAAGALHVSQPALSAQIRELERRLGFSLFMRTSRKVELTREGSLFIGNARRIILETEYLAQVARDICNKPLRIGVAHFSGLIPERVQLLEAFMRQHPSVPIKVSGRQHAQLFEDLHSGAIDASITLEPQVSVNSSAVESHGAAERIERIALGRRRVALRIPREHPMSQRAVLVPSALVGQPICLVSRAHGILLAETILFQLLKASGAEGLRPPEGDAVSAIRYAALRRLPVIDLGWFPMPPDLTKDSMIRREVKGWGLDLDLVVSRSTQGHHPSLDLFWSFLSTRMKTLKVNTDVS